MKEYQQSAPMAAPSVPFSEAERVSPRYAGTAIAAMIGLPLAAGIAGAVIALMLAVAVDFAAPWHLAAAGFAITGAVALYITMDNMMRLVEERQTITGTVATPAPSESPPHRVQIEITEPEAGRWRLVDLPNVTPAQLAELARGLCLGRPFAESEWCGAGRLFSKPAFVAMRVELLERGIVAPRNPEAPAQGFGLTPAGRHIMARIAELEPSTARNRTHASTPAQLTAGTNEE